MSHANRWFSASKFFGPGRAGKSRGAGRCERRRRGLRPVVTGLEERQLLTNYALATVASFNQGNGASPVGSLIMDGQGNLYGTTSAGGAYDDGTVFEIARGSNTITTLASFNGSNGAAPYNGNLILDGQGNLYGTTFVGGAFNDGTVFEVAKGSNTITDLVSFNVCCDGQRTDGGFPSSSLVLDGQGNLYGTTTEGGALAEDKGGLGGGTVFEIAKGSDTLTDLASFDFASYPCGGVVLDGQGNLYGTTFVGGLYGDNDGTVFEIAKGSNTITTIATFNYANGASSLSGVILDGQGNLYGTTTKGGEYGYGTVFEIANGSNTITTIASFIEANGPPADGVVLDAQGNLYGTTTGGGAYFDNDGTVFEIAKGSNTITTIASFNEANGAVPYGGVILDGQGNLYGTTERGGPNGFGTVFELSPQPTTPVMGTSSPDPSIYGQAVTLSAMVMPSTATGTVTFFDGTTNLGTAALVNGTATLATTTLAVGTNLLTASYGGDANDPPGTSPVFDQVVNQVVNQIATTTTVTASPNPQYAGQPVTLSAAVSPSASGAGEPTGSVSFFDGTTELGTGTLGSNGTASFTTSALPVGSDAITAQYLGDANYSGSTSGEINEQINLIGTSVVLVSSKNPSMPNQLVTFTATVTPGSEVDGSPTGDVILQDAAGVLGTAALVDGVAAFNVSLPPGLYAVTASYGPTADFAAGTSNAVNESVSKYSLITLASFDGPEANADNYGGVVVDAQGNLYGTTWTGGAYNDGTVYEVAKGSGMITALASFNGGSSGAFPLGGVVLDGDGNLYGTTYEGGAYGVGTVFEIAKDSSTITTLASFDYVNGANPEAGVVLDGQGNLYGTTVGGGPGLVSGTGTVFEIAKGSKSITTLACFGAVLPDPMGPGAGVVLDAEGNLYGTTSFGGANNKGAVFEIAKGSSTITTLVSFSNLNQPSAYAGVVVDGQGNLYGTDGGSVSSTGGAVFEIIKGSNNLTTLASFPTSPLVISGAGVVLDAQGNIYGTTDGGSSNVAGTVFEIAKGSSTINTIASINNYSPSSGLGLVLDSQGDFYGTTDGTVFELSPVTATAVTVASSVTPSVYGESVTLSATVVPSTAAGAVTFYDGATSLGTGTLVNGTATLSTTVLGAGSDSITANYGGDANDAPGTSPVFTQVVNQDATTTRLTASPSPQYAGQPVTLTATVSASAPGAGTATGTVTFFDGTIDLGSASLDDTDTATLSGILLAAGAHSITATYAGDTDFITSTSNAASEQINLIGTSVALVSSANPANPNQLLTFTAMVTPSSDVDGAPTGDVVFRDGAGLLGTAPLVDGVATFGASFPPGSYAVTASYGPTSDFAAGASSAVNEQVLNYSLSTLASLDGTDQTQNDYGGVTVDAQGNLYGTTTLGGAYDDGMVYEIVKGSNTVTTLASFNHSNGSLPLGGVVLDGQGNLYGTTRQGGAYERGTVFEIAKDSCTITTLATFNGGSDGLLDNGEYPDAGVVVDSQGNLYGTTESGGPDLGVDDGTVFEVVKGSKTITTLAAFGDVSGPGGLTEPNGDSPGSGVVLDAQGNLYGTTNIGGANNAGTVFEILKGSNTITTLVSFNEYNPPSAYAGVVVDSQGDLYGISGANYPSGNGYVFEIANGTHSITTVASFPTAQFSGASVVLDGQGNLYGTTDFNPYAPGGSAFEIAKGSSTITTIATFNDGYAPSAGLGLVLDGQGNLYGTTTAGGAFGGAGTVFELSPPEPMVNAPVTVTSSPNPSVYGQSVTLSATVLPATATGTITFFDGTTSLGTATLINGTATLATSALAIGSNSIIAYYGGDANDSPGTSPAFNQVVGQDATTTAVTAPSGPQYAGQDVTLTATVSASAPGSGTPTGSVTFFDGTTDLGTAALDSNGSTTLTTSSLTVGSNAITAQYSGDGNFAGSPATTTEQVDLIGTTVTLVSSANPANPNQSLTFTAAVTPASEIDGTPSGDVVFQDDAGVLGSAPLVDGVATFTTSFPLGSYAVTASYGPTPDFAAGTSNAVNELVPNSQLIPNYSLTTVASFNQGNGASPVGSLIMDGQGNLYGTTSAGGAYDDGTVFEIARGSNTITTLASFNGSNGAAPYNGNLILDGQGNLYGTTFVGGAFNDGTVFEVAKGSNTITDLVSFNVCCDGQRTDGGFPSSSLVLDGQGNLYGTTTEGGALAEDKGGLGGGTVFEIAKGSDTLTDLASFDFASYPCGGVVLDGQGNLYGTTFVGGLYGDNDGTVFEIAKGSNTITTIATFNYANGASSLSGVILDGQGNLYGTTTKGGEYGYGTVFEIANGSNTITTIASFIEANGPRPTAWFWTPRATSTAPPLEAEHTLTTTEQCSRSPRGPTPSPQSPRSTRPTERSRTAA